MIRAPLPTSLTPLAKKLGLQPLYGDIHNHCALSYGHGSLPGALARARLQLDFVSITGHAAWPDMPIDDPSVAHIVNFHEKGFAKLKAGWLEHFTTLQTYDHDAAFTVFPGYEIHSCEHGDYTIVYADVKPSEILLADNPAALGDLLKQEKKGRALAFPHHIGYRQGARGINWDSFDSGLSPFVEMFSMHGCAETSESDRGYLHSMGPVDGNSTMQAGLARGARFGVVGNTDHHSGFPGSYGHGRTGIYTRGTSRQAIWDALTDGRTNALTGDNSHLLVAINETVQGGIVAPVGNAQLSVEAVCGGFIDTIDIVRNGNLFARVSPELSPAPIATHDEDRATTVLYLELGWGARGQSHRWSGQISLEAGELKSIEPRFRGQEIVSPLEGEDAGHPLPEIAYKDGKVRFTVTAEANPNNVTPATQGLLIRICVTDDTVIHAELSGKKLAIPARQLFDGALSGNLGAIDTPAYRFHMLPRLHQWQWAGDIPLGTIESGENIYVRMRQRDGQMAWTSPIFCREDAQ